MARSLSKSTHLLWLPISTTTIKPLSHLLLLVPFRSNSNLPYFSNTDTDDLSSSSSNDPILTLEDAIHKIILRRSAPDWLPFLPGSSYWVPPSRSSAVAACGIVNLIQKLSQASLSQGSLSSSSSSSLSSSSYRGWPSSDYFLTGASLQEMELKATLKEVEMETLSSNVSKSEDEEG